MSALITQERTSVNQPGYTVSNYAGPLIPITMPPLSISFAKDIPQEAMDKIKEMGGQDQMIQRSRVYLIPEYTPDFVRDMNRSGAIKTAPSPMNTINISCIPIIAYMRKIISCFLRVHTYPAFRDEEHLESLEELKMVHPVTTAQKRKAGKSKSTGRKRKVTRQESTSRVEEPEMEIDEEEEQDQEEPTHSQDEIIVALAPSGKLPGWGDETEVPVGHGMFFKYVPELAEFDNRTIPEIISKYFFYALGTTETDIRRTFEDIRVANGIISNTTLGCELSHLFKVIDIALTGQGRAFPIYSDGHYTGCVVSGFGFTVAIYKEVHHPVPYQRLTQIVLESSPFKHTLDQIMSIVPDHDNITDKYTLESKDVTSMLALRRFVLERDINEQHRDEIRRLAMKLKFKQQYWGLSSSTIAHALHLVSLEREDLPDDLPLHPSMLFEKDDLAYIWSGFGMLAPTCVFTGGPLVDLASPTQTTGKIDFDKLPYPTPSEKCKVSSVTRNSLKVREIGEVAISKIVILKEIKQRSCGPHYENLQA